MFYVTIFKDKRLDDMEANLHTRHRTDRELLVEI